MAVSLDAAYEERVYAGILGKLIGVYLGRPVEGWAYGDIQERFGLVDRYVNAELGLPLIVADDDISGTLAFGRVAEDAPAAEFDAADAGNTWLNYIVEDRTILWWGGYGRSTEHTAFLNLKNGIAAPDSGSIARNGSTLAEQIGAQIFSDAFALMAPGDPARAVRLTRAAASVSHDGVALDAAAFFAAMRSLAFVEADLGELIHRARAFVADARLIDLVDDVRSQVREGDDWREVRDWVDANYGYAHYPGPCHALSNTAMSLAALIAGGDDFRHVVAIASSVGFDTDSNAGTVGCITGVRLGLRAFDGADDLREPVADRALVVSADGGECVTDAVLETRRILRSAQRLRGLAAEERRPRFGFEFAGATQGFAPCPYAGGSATVRHRILPDGGAALALTAGPGATASVSTPVFLDPREAVTNFSTLASPTLYPGTTVRATLSATAGGAARLFAVADTTDGARIVEGGWVTLGDAPLTLEWVVPQVEGGVVFRIGVAVRAEVDGDAPDAFLHRMDWEGAPAEYAQTGILLSSIWDTRPRGLAPWVSSAKNFEADFATSFSVSHPGPLGVVTTGTRDWIDYSVSSDLTFSLNRSAGLVARARGHRTFVAALFDGRMVSIIEQRDDERTLLATAPFAAQRDRAYAVSLSCTGPDVRVNVDGSTVVSATTSRTAGGGGGFFIDTGTMSADGFTVRSLHRAQPA